jgi:hypothetical protein
VCSARVGRSASCGWPGGALRGLALRACGSGPVGCVGTWSARFVPLKPVTKRASAVGQGTVIVKMTVFECAVVYPRHFVCEVPRGQRPPKFLIEHHRGITAIARDYAAQWPEVIMAHSGFWCVIDLDCEPRFRCSIRRRKTSVEPRGVDAAQSEEFAIPEFS